MKRRLLQLEISILSRWPTGPILKWWEIVIILTPIILYVVIVLLDHHQAANHIMLDRMERGIIE